jgi:ribonuclease HI
MMTERTKIYFDGGCRPNPGTMETAVVVRGVTHIRSDCGLGTNNDAEWLALLHALEIARSMELRDIIILGDSAMVVAQAQHRARPRTASFRDYLESFDRLAAAFATVAVRRISRHQNLAGIALAKSHL